MNLIKMVAMLLLSLLACRPADGDTYLILTPPVEANDAEIVALSRCGRVAILQSGSKLQSWEIASGNVRKLYEFEPTQVVNVVGFLDSDRCLVNVDKRNVFEFSISGERVEIPGPGGAFDYFWAEKCAGRFATGVGYDEENEKEAALVWDLDQRTCSELTDPLLLLSDVNAKGETIGTVGRQGFFKAGDKELRVRAELPFRYVLFERVGRSGRVTGVLDGRFPFLWSESDGFQRLPHGAGQPEIARIYDVNDSDIVLGSIKAIDTDGEQEAVIWNGQDLTKPFMILGRSVDGLGQNDYISAGKTISNDGKILVSGVFDGSVDSRLLVPSKLKEEEKVPGTAPGAD